MLTPSNREYEKANVVNENFTEYPIHGQSSLYIINVSRRRRRHRRRHTHYTCVCVYVRVCLIDCNYLYLTIGMPSSLLHCTHAKRFPPAILRLCHT